LQGAIRLIIDGDPVPWKAHGGYGRRSFNPRWKEKEYFQHKIEEQYDGPLISSAVSLDTIFYVSIPKSASKKKRELMLSGGIRPTKRPDATNMRKFTEDCLNGTVLEDDSQVVNGCLQKWYSETPRTEIIVVALV